MTLPHGKACKGPRDGGGRGSGGHAIRIPETEVVEAGDGGCHAYHSGEDSEHHKESSCSIPHWEVNW